MALQRAFVASMWLPTLITFCPISPEDPRPPIDSSLYKSLISIFFDIINITGIPLATGDGVAHVANITFRIERISGSHASANAFTAVLANIGACHFSDSSDGYKDSRKSLS
jgi:hypothetical protein